MKGDLPAGTVTFLFTDVEGSTKLLHELGAEAYAEALAEHRRVIREAAAAHGGVEVDTQGDAFFVAFPTAPGALAAAAAARDALAIPVRMGLHSGTPLLTEEGYVGPDVHRAARIAAAGHGRQILVSSSTAALVDAELCDLGPHRLKDLSAPERIFQLGDGEFPPLKSLHQTNLPIPATPFLGREKELPEVVGLLDGTRLLTLTGPGGSGKTRLALQAAALAAEGYPDGVWWVPLAPLRDPQLVLSTASQALGGRNGPAEHIGDKRMLILLDNFEQVADAAPDVAQLLSSCPNLAVLVTSREPLHVSGEQEYAVPPLAHEEGVGFFLARARAAVPAFKPDEHVSEICQRLDDLPLALELAAARVKALTTQQIIERLQRRLPLLTGGARDAPERHRTLRATIEWSYELLTEDEQELFAELGVFRGGCTLDAAEAVADADVDTLQSLVEKSLVRHTGDRYWMLETIREFAAEQTDDSVRDHHAQYFLALAEEAEPHLHAHEADWIERLGVDRDNLRAALDWLEENGETDPFMRLVVAASRLWYLKGLWHEMRRRVEAALAADASPTPARAKVLLESVRSAALTGDYETARVRVDDAQLLCETLGDRPGSAQARFLRGLVEVEAGNFVAAREPLEESLQMLSELGDEHAAGVAASNLAWTYHELGDFDRAHALNEENRLRAEAVGDARLHFISLMALAADAERTGETAKARALLKESIQASHEMGDPVHTSSALLRIAQLEATSGSAETAAMLFGRAMETLEGLRADLPPYIATRRDATQAALGEQLDEERMKETLARGRALSLDTAVELALEDRGLAE